MKISSIYDILSLVIDNKSCWTHSSWKPDLLLYIIQAVISFSLLSHVLVRFC
jgi:hypothetical protein